MRDSTKELGQDRIWIAHILPFDSSHDARGYTYAIPAELSERIRVGQMVQIPLRNEMSEGIVAEVASTDTLDESIKSISAVLTDPVLWEPQIATMLRYAARNGLHIHKVLSLFLPAVIRKRILKYGLPEILENPVDAEAASENPIPTQPFQKPELIYAKSSAEALQTAVQLLLIPGTVVIAPSDRYVEMAMALIPQTENPTPDSESKSDSNGNPPLGIGRLRSDATETARAKFWMDIAAKKHQSIIWSRRIVLYNLSNFDRIVYLEDSLFRELLHSFHKYRVIDLLLDLVRNSGQVCKIVSSTPSIEVAALSLAKEIQLESSSL